MSKTYWDTRVNHYDRPHPRLKRIASILERLRPKPTDVLDVGCGQATLKSLLPASIDYFGVDFAVDDLANDDPEHFSCEDLNDPGSFAGVTFDAVVCSGVFEYIRQPEPFLAYIADKVAEDGRLIFSYTNREHYLDLLPALLGKRRNYPDPHVNFMSIRTAVLMLREVGFQVEDYDVLTAASWHKALATRSTRSPWNLLTRQYVLLLSRPSMKSIEASCERSSIVSI